MNMNSAIRIGALITLAAVVLVHASLHAGEKKDKDKDKKQEDVVVNDTLTNKELKDKVRTSCFCKTYVFKMVEGKSYQLDMKSKDFDSYLRIENLEGQQVAADDDGGGYPDARINYRAPKTGDYTIICTTFGNGSTGKYTLLVKELP
jgi:hypothetical protein